MTAPDNRAKRRGGAIPATVQGWLAVLGFVVLLLAITRLVRSNLLRLGLIVPLVAGFMVLAKRMTDDGRRRTSASRD